MTTPDQNLQLALVRSDSIRFHENPEGKRTDRLVGRLRDEKKIRNPPIVAQVGEDSYVLLDGANRVSALRKLGLTHIPVQVIDYADPDVQLKGWHHLLVEGKGLNLRAVYADLPGVELLEMDESQAGASLELRRLFAVFMDEERRFWGVHPSSGSVQLVPWMQTLGKIVEAYEGRTRLERIKIAEFADLPKVFETVEHELVLFPTLTKIDLLRLVNDEVRIPTGITRHLIPGRALGMNLDLSFLSDLESEEEKVRHFEAFLDDLRFHGRIRYYEESAFILNE